MLTANEVMEPRSREPSTDNSQEEHLVFSTLTNLEVKERKKKKRKKKLL